MRLIMTLHTMAWGLSARPDLIASRGIRLGVLERDKVVVAGCGLLD